MSEASPDASRPEPRRVDWLLTDIDWLVTCDGALCCWRSGAVAIAGDRVAGIGATEALRQEFIGERELSLRGHIVCPGLINAHAHAAMSCLRGLGDDLPLLQWLQEVIFPAEAAMVNPEMVYWGTLLSCIEMLQNGITTFCDGYFFEESAARAAQDAGMRAVLGQGILDFPTPDAPDPKRARQRAEAFLEAFPHGVSSLRPSLFCHAPYTCSPETLKWVKALCREHGLLFQTHLSETAGEVKDIEQRYGKRPAFFLDSLGLLDQQTLCAHGVWLSPEEIGLLARRGTGVSQTIESNMKLASGIPPLPELLEAGVRVGLGTDGSASNNDLDLFSEMDRTAKIHKVIRKDPTICPAPQVLRLATRGGASVLGWSEAVGSLEPGKQADLIALDCNQPHLTPLYDPISHLVYAARGSDVRHVWVAGQQVVADGKVLTVDAAEAMQAVERIARR